MKVLRKDITSVDSGIIVHGVNCQGVMGSGVALAIRRKWPAVYDLYLSACSKAKPRETLLGQIQIVPVQHPDLYVVNLFSQTHYGRDRRKYACPNAIRQGLMQACDFSDLVGKKPMYLPRIGAGLGGLDWESEVVPVIAEVEGYCRKEFIICEIQEMA